MEVPFTPLSTAKKASSSTLLEVAVLEYPGSLRAAAPVLSELAQRCNRTAAAGKCHGGRMLVTRWTVSSQGMYRVAGSELFGKAAPAIVVIPGNEPSWTLPQPDERILDWLRDCHEAGSVLAGCDEGVLVLACSGLLAGRAVSLPNLARCPSLSSMVPSWIPGERTLVDDGDLITAAGPEAWKYLSLRLLARVYGQSVMTATIQQLQLVIPRAVQDDLERFSPNFAHGDRCILKAQRWLHTIHARCITLQDICDSSGLEPRTLQRRFLRATGLRPIEYCQRLRIAKALMMMQGGSLIEEAAWVVGYTDQSAFRRLFLRFVGTTPARYRRQLLAQRRERLRAGAPAAAAVPAAAMRSAA